MKLPARIQLIILFLGVEKRRLSGQVCEKFKRTIPLWL